MRPKTIRIRALFSLFVATLAIPFAAQAQTNGSANIAATDVYIAGSSLALEDVTATTGLNIPVSIQTSFGGLKNEQAPSVPELSAVGDLTGPGIATPIQLHTDPGKAFTIPGLSTEGTYLLQNVRLMRGSTFVQTAVPSSAAITVADILKTKVSVRQLTAAELRERGITIDARNFDVYEYTLSFFVGTQEVLVPFPVMIDKRTHEVIPINKEQIYAFPGFKNAPAPPRWGPPKVTPIELVEPGDLPGPPPQDDGVQPPPRPTIPAAIVIPNSLGVLHQFFAVALTVTNNAPDGSSITLDSLTATMKNPPELRVADTKPAVSFGRPVPLVDPNTGTTILIAQGKAEADWTLEGLKTGTHTFTIEVHATYKASPSAQPIQLVGSINEQIVIHDPRFNITFSHPDVVRAGLTYSTFTFVTNMTSSTQTIRLRTGDELPACSIGGGADVCRLDDDISNVPLCSSSPVDVCRPSDDLKAEEVTLRPGATRTLVYKLRSSLTGNVFATAGTVDSDVIHAAVQLHMGVSTSGIPLSPATLVMPYYAQYLDEKFVTDNLQLLGLGYSLATAPVNQVTAALPRVITTDVFHRAVDIARAGQRIFIGEDKRDTFANLTLDNLGNGQGNKLEEWDELRRREYSGRVAGASLGRQIEAASLKTGADFDTYLTRFGQTTAHRAPYLVAVTHGVPVSGNDRPYAISLKGAATHSVLDLPNELATEDSLGKRDIAFGDLMKLTSVDHAQTGELAAVGIWNENFELTITPAAGSSFTLDVLYPSATAARIQHAIVSVSNASGRPLKALLDRTSATVTLLEEGGSASYSANATEILPAPLAIIAAHQDMHLDSEGHKLSVLFNRPVDAATDYKTKFAGRVQFDQGSIHYTGPRGVDAAALQDDERTVNLTFDHSLSKNAIYSMQVQPITDPLSGNPVSFADVVPVIENNRPAGIIYGRVLRGDNSIVPGAQVVLRSASGVQYDTSSAAKADFLFEYILRDVTLEINGAYSLSATDQNGKYTHVDGAVRLTGVAETVNLVYLGRGSAEGRVTYDNGEVVANAKIVVGSTLFNQFRSTTTGTDGRFHVGDLPVGPLTFSATDTAGNTAFAASEVRSAGEIVSQDLSIYRQPFPGLGTIRGIVVRSDNHEPIANAHVGVYTQGYGLTDGYSDASGRFEFDKVTTGLVTVLAEDWSIARKAVGEDFELVNDQVKDLTLTLEVSTTEQLANLEGDVEEEDSVNQGTYHKVPGALVQIKNTQVVTADANGHFTYPSIPLTLGGKDITVYNPASKRTAMSSVPTLDPLVTAYLRIPIKVSDAFGTGTAQVRVLNAAGVPVSNLRVFEAGYPIEEFTPIGGGKYQRSNVPVGRTITVWAIAAGDASDPQTSRYLYGDQYTNGSVSIVFNGQTALTVLRLQGQGKVRTRLLTDIISIGNVNLTYKKWDDEQQGLSDNTVTVSTKDPATGQAAFAVFDKVPVGGFSVSASLANFGYDSASQNLVYDGQVIDIDLHAKKLASLAGVVYNIDGITPMPGVPVKMTDGAQTQTSVTGLDGSFKFGNVAAGNGFTITAEATVGGISRVGRADGQAPPNGGPLNNINVTMKQQGSIEGFVVYSGYKVFDPNDSSKNVLDDTPNDLSDNARVPLAQFILREVSYPYHSYGKETAPLTSDINGHFIINNIFVGPVRLTAWSQQNQDLRGDGQTTLTQEGSTATVYAAIGANGFGPLVVTVLDPNNHNAPVENAEVGLIIPAAFAPPVIFDFGTTDANGTIRFEQVPARGGFEIDAFSKLVGKSGTVKNVTVLPVTGASAVVLLEFSGSVNGKLTDPEAANAGVPGVPVVLTASTYYQQEASTAVDGTFFLGGIHEGPFTLDAMNEVSRRKAHAQGAVSAADPNPTINMELEHTSPLYVKVFYPADDGSQSATEVPTSDIEVKQRCRSIAYGGEICEYKRTLQGNGLQFTQLFASDGYAVSATEIGGDRRNVGGGGAFPVGATAGNPYKLTLPAYGTVEVTVRQPGAGGVMQPAVGARVRFGNISISTDTNGLAIAHHVPLGDLSVNAVSFDETFSAYSPTVHLGSQSIPLQVTLELASSAGVTGLVNAETGGPSVNTRVVASWPGHSANVLTDANGSYKFQGIAVSTAGPTAVWLTYFGPDDRIVGNAQGTTLTVADASQIRTLPTVTIDATPPTVVSIKPEDNSLDVSPDSSIVVAFSEPIAATSISHGSIRLSPTDGSSDVNTSITYGIDPVTGLFTVTATPPPSTDPVQRFPLKSNMLYRVTLTAGITDLQGHPLSQRGFTFITADYIAPKVVQIEPATNVPLSASTTFNAHFNKPLASQLFDSGHTVVAPLEVHFYKLSGPGGSIVSSLPGRAYGDTTNQIVSFAPSDQLEEKSYYRLTFIGVRDKLGNVADPISYDYFSFDKTAPFITFEPLPVAAGQPIVSGVRYTLKTALHDGSATGALSTDVARVDFFRVDGTTKTLIASLTKAPFEYAFVGPTVTTTGSTLTFHVEASDTSFNNATPQEITFDLAPNLPPQDVRLTLNTPDPIYPGRIVSATPSLTDEGVLVTLQAQLTGTNTDGTPYSGTRITGSATRAKASDPWTFTPATFDTTLPTTLQDGSTASFTITAADGVNAIVTGTPATFTVATDTNAPVISSLTVSPASPYHLNDHYTITAVVKDSESGISDLTFTYDGITKTLKPGDAGVTLLSDGSYRFVSAQITVPAKNDDTLIAIVAAARDFRGNRGTRATEVTYVGVHDTSLPRGAWASPIGKAAWPSDQTAFATTLRVWAKDDQAITGVKFVVPGIANPIDATAAGNDLYTANVTVATPAAGTDFAVTALVSDADSAHTQNVTIPITLVKIDTTLPPNFTQAIISTTDSLAGKNVLVQGPNTHLVMHVPFTFKNLIVIDGGSVETLGSTTSTERKLDLTVSDTLYVDSDSSINVSGKGYLGGWAVNPDSSGTKNDDARGRTIGNTVTGGPTTGASASHAGVGGESVGITNRIYGSITNPHALGTGGAGSSTCCTAGGPGGGAATVSGGSGNNDLGRIIVAGSIKADGLQGSAAAGAGGSIIVNGRLVSLGYSGRITANGGDDAAGTNVSRGGSGGRVAVIASEQLDADLTLPQFQSRGGRNLGTEGRSQLDAGAGTVYIRRPGQQYGELAISSLDERATSTTHLTRPTIVGYAGSGNSTALTANTLTDSSRTFVSDAIGEELSLGGDTTKSYTVTAVSSDGHTLTTDSADGSLLNANGVNNGVVAYAGLVTFDAIRVTDRALARFDNSFAIGGVVDDLSKATVTSSSVMLRRTDVPSVTSFTTTPAGGAQLIRGSNLAVSYTIASAAGIGTTSLVFSPVATPFNDTYSDYVTPASQNKSIAVASDAALGAATLTLSATDRAGRKVTSAPFSYTVIENSAPLITRFDVVPDTLYPGHNVVATVSATDELSVTKLSVTSTIGNGTPSTQTLTPNTPAVTDQNFTLTVPATTPGGTSMTVDVTAEDNLSNKRTQTKSVTILTDAVAPVVNITQPAANLLIQEQGGATFTVKATAVDAEVGVKTITVKAGDGAPVTMVADPAVPNGFKADVPIPNVDGIDPVPVTVVVTASDYQGNSSVANVTIQEQPFFDPNGPVITILCPTSDALLPAGYTTKIRVNAIGNNVGNGSNVISKVEFYINESATPIVGTAVSGLANVYEASYAIPAGAADGEIDTIRVIATNTASKQSDATTHFTVITGGTAITADTTVSATDTHLDNQTIIIKGAKLTIDGAHTFTRLLVLDGASVTHPAVATGSAGVRLTVTGTTYVSCTGAIDANSTGYAAGVSYPGTTVPASGTGGSHIGVGGFWSAPLGSTFGSIYHPAEAGGGTGAGGPLAAGGGIIRLTTGTLQNDGAIRANGAYVPDRSGAGGSVWITATNLAGSGSITANGGDDTDNRVTGSGGGGAIAIEYQNATGPTLTNATARTGVPSGSWNRPGGAGTVYVKGPGATFGDLTINNKGYGSAQLVDFPALGNGIAQSGSSGATLVTDRATNVPAYFVFHWVEISDAAGNLKGTWRIATINNKTVTLSPNGSETISVAAGDKWQGVYRFDNLRTVNGESIHSTDPIRIGTNGIINLTGPATAGQTLTLSDAVTGTTVTVTGNVAVPGITATTLVVRNGAKLSGLVNGATPVPLTLNISGTITVENGGSIDVSGAGYAAGATYPGETGPGNGTGGSHIGVGGFWNNPLGTTFGSVYHPAEAGGGTGAGGPLAPGGGILRITAGTLQNDGAIRANGSYVPDRSGAGGSVWITATTVGGNGTISANGGDDTDNRLTGPGGGGAISIEYQQTASGTLLSNLTARSGQPSGSWNVRGGAGTVFLKGPGATYGDVTINNISTAGQATVLPSLGSGVTQTGTSGATVVTDRATNTPPYFISHWVEISDASGTLKGTWRIASINNKTITLAPNGSETISVAVGDKWQGVYRFDNLRAVSGEPIRSTDPIRLGVNGIISLAGPTTAGQTLTLNDTVTGSSVTVTGNVAVPGITAATLVVKNGAKLTSLVNGATPVPLTLNISGTFTVETGGSIDVSGTGYAAGATYPGETGPGNGTGGSHIGVGGFWNNPLGTTFGSVYHPSEAGGGTGAGGPLAPGGGILRVTAGTLQNDGAIRANGSYVPDRSGAGGSIWITATTVGGNGTISANGGDDTDNRLTGPGGGGAIAIEYQQTSSGTLLANLTARSGQPSGSWNVRGSAGTVYLKGPGATYGDVTINNISTAGQATVLPSLGSGVTQTGTSGATVVTDRATNIPPYFISHWVEISDASGTLKGSWRIASINNKTITLAPNGSETISVAVGDKWQGVYRFDTINTPIGAKITGNDPIRIGINGNTVIAGPAGTLVLDLPYAINATDVTISGNVLLGGAITATSSVTINNGTTTTSAVTAPTLHVSSGGKLSTASNGSTPVPFTINVSGTITVDNGGSIDVTGAGYPAGATYPGETAPGNGTGGSHIGVGGFWNNPLGTTFGSVYRPSEAGGGTGAGGPAAPGGGILRINAGTLQNDGAIRANGAYVPDRSGAGGSIWITATTVGGNGTIAANGGDDTDNRLTGPGGGGAIAIEYQQTSSGTLLANLSARSGQPSGSWNVRAGAGSVYLKGPGATYGDLIVDDKTVAAAQLTSLPALGIGIAQAGTSGITLVTDRTINIPAYFVGHWVNIADSNGVAKGSWRIATINNKTVTLAPNGSETITLQQGDRWRGSYKLDHLTLNNAKFETADLVELGNPVSSTASTYIFGNTSAPAIDLSKISFTVGAAGPALLAAANAVTDVDAPILVTATNTRTHVTWTTTINSGAAFAIGLSGNQGDAITIRAKDSHKFPLETSDLAAGTLPASSPVSTQINASTWTGDTQFVPRTVSADGRTLVVATYPWGNNGTSDKLAIVDISDPSRPTLKRMVSTVNRVLDVKAVNGWAYVAGDRFGTISLTDPNATINLTGDPCGRDYSVAVIGGYAFTGEVDCNNDSRVNIYDVSNPAAPRYIRQQGMGVGNHAFTHLYTLGTDYLVGVSGWGSGRDVMVIDHRDVNNLKKVSELQIPNLTAFRGKVVGTKLYLVANDAAQLVVVDLTNLAAPVVSGTLTLPAAATGIDVVGNDVLIADFASGLVTTTADPANLALTGSATTGGNAFDITVANGYAYVANEIGLAVVPVSVAPVINTDHITLGFTGTSVTVTGTAGAVTGQAVTLKITDTTSNAFIDGITPAFDGSFTTSLAAASGDTITLTATDSLSRVSGPVTLGTVPFGTATTLVPIASPAGDTDWRARTIKLEANNLAMTAFPDQFGTSDKIVVYDVSTPAAPVFKRTISTVNRVLDFDIQNGWAFVAGDRFGTVNLNDPNSSINLTGDPCGRDYSVVVSGGYAFTGEVDCNNDSRLNIYDVTTPAAPRYLRQQGMGVGNHAFTDLIAYGSDYIIGLSTWGSNRDVMVIDRRDINNLVKVSELQIPNIDAFRGRIVGNRLYLGSYGTGGAAIVDLSNIASPRLVTQSAAPNFSRGLDLAGKTLAVASGNGVTFYDISNDTFAPLGTQPVSGAAWDVVFGNGALYAAAEQGLVVIPNISAPPQIDTRLITVAASSQSMATVTGKTGAVSGQTPFVTELKDAASGASISVTIAADGSFTSSIPAAAFDTITLKVTDASNRVAGPTVLGTMPFGSAITMVPIGNPGGDTSWRARTIKIEGNNLGLAAFPGDSFGTSDKILLYDISNPDAPVLKRTISTVNRVLDFDIQNGYAFVAGDRFGTINLNDPNSTINLTGDPCGRDYSVVVSGGYAFTGEVDCNNDSRLNIYEVTNPAAPRYLRQQGMGVGNHAFTDLLAYGSDYLIGLSTWGSNRDVMVIDRRDVNNLVKVAELQIANIDAFRGRISGTRLYLGTFGTGGAAIVDLSNIASPRLVTSTVGDPIFSRGADLAGSTLAVANGSSGVAFYDVSNDTFTSLGKQPTGGVVWDVVFNGANLYAAADQGLVVIRSVTAPPQIDTRLISVGTDGTNAIVHGSAGAITGAGSLTVDVKDTATGATLTVPVSGTGGFDTSFAAASGDPITVKAHDSANRSAGPVLVGNVPFGTAVNLYPVTNPSNDTDWRARTIKVEGNNLGMAAFPDTFGTSDKIVVYDITNPGVPVLKRVVPTVNRILDFEIKGGWAYVAGDRFGTINLNDPNATINLTGDPCGRDYSVAVAGGFAFTGEVDCNNDSRLNIYDVGDPGSPRFIRQQAMGVGNHAFTDLVTYGSDYLIGISTWGSGRDVMIIDRRDVFNLKKVSELLIPQIDAFRAKVVGTKLYLGTYGTGGLAIVDVANPAAPAVLTVTSGDPIYSRGLDLAGNVLAAANSGSGVTFYDISANTLTRLGTQPVGGVVWDLAFNAGNLYVANDQGLVVVQNVGTPPDIKTGLITMTPATGTTIVTGADRSIGGVGATTVTVTNTTTSASVSGVAVSATGSFTATITSSPGDKLSITATDAANRSATRSLGGAPFFSVTAEFRGNRDADLNLLVRRVLTDNTHVAVLPMRTELWYPGPSSGGWTYTSGASALNFFTAGSGVIQDATLKGNFVFCSSDRLVSFDITQTTPTLNVASGDPCGREIGIAASGNYVYTGEVDCNNDGRLNIWNVTNPAAPAFVSQTGGLAGSGGVSYHVLVALGTQYLLAVTPDTGVRDVTVFNISNPTAPVKVTTFDVPNFAPDAAIVDGNTLYLANFGGGIAIVDMTNPAAPVLQSTIATPGLARGLAMVGTNELAVAEGVMGLTFINVADKAHPVIEGTQAVNGSAHDVKAVGKTLYVAAETRFMTLQRP